METKNNNYRGKHMFKKLLLGITLALGCSAMQAGPIDWITTKYAQARLVACRLFYPQWYQQQTAMANLESFLSRNILDMESAGKIYGNRLGSIDRHIHPENSPDELNWHHRVTQKRISELTEDIANIKTRRQNHESNDAAYQLSSGIVLTRLNQELEDAQIKLNNLAQRKRETEEWIQKMDAINEEHKAYILQKKAELETELSKTEYQNIPNPNVLKSAILNSRWLLSAPLCNYVAYDALFQWANKDIRLVRQELIKKQKLKPGSTKCFSFIDELRWKYINLSPQEKSAQKKEDARHQMEFKKWQEAQPSYADAKAWFDSMRTKHNTIRLSHAYSREAFLKQNRLAQGDMLSKEDAALIAAHRAKIAQSVLQ